MSDSLLQLPECGGVQFVIQLWLPNQQNLQQFLPGGFQIRQKANFFQKVGRKMVRFVYHQDRGELSRTSVDQILAEIEKNLALVPARGRETKVARDILQELNGRHPIVEHLRVGHCLLYTSDAADEE